MTAPAENFRAQRRIRQMWPRNRWPLGAPDENEEATPTASSSKEEKVVESFSLLYSVCFSHSGGRRGDDLQAGD
jgi:hypothetical protein